MTVLHGFDSEGQATADALVANRARMLAAEAVELGLAAHWADLHNADSLGPTRPTGGRVLPGTERAKSLGGAGTPLVGEFAAAELACLLHVGPVAASNLVADALDIRHRLPGLWAALRVPGQDADDGTDATDTEDEPDRVPVRVWQAREVARRTRAAGLTLPQARWVDDQTTPYLPSLPWGRFLDLLEAKIIAADPEAAEQRRIAAAMDRFVSTGRCNEFGLKTIIAKAVSGDAIYFVAMCDRIAQILLLEGDTDPVGARRSKAIGILAQPVRAMALLARYAGADRSDVGTRPSRTDPDRTAGPPRPIHPGDLHPADDDADDPLPCPACGGRPGDRSGDPTPFVRPVLDHLADLDPRRLLPTATLHVHLSRESFAAALAGSPQGVARMEEVGPVTVQQVCDFLGHSNVTVLPVLDLDEDQPVDGYEVPTRMREQLRQRTPACVFPWSSNLSRRTDADHTIPYRHTEDCTPPSGRPSRQTRIGNLGPLGRFPHRVKTHAPGWRHRQPVPGVFLWRTPHGYWYRVDATGTHPLGTNPTDEQLAGRALAPRAGSTGRPGRSPMETHFAALIAAA